MSKSTCSLAVLVLTLVVVLDVVSAGRNKRGRRGHEVRHERSRGLLPGPPENGQLQHVGRETQDATRGVVASDGRHVRHTGRRKSRGGGGRRQRRKSRRRRAHRKVISTTTEEPQDPVRRKEEADPGFIKIRDMITRMRKLKNSRSKHVVNSYKLYQKGGTSNGRIKPKNAAKITGYSGFTEEFKLGGKIKLTCQAWGKPRPRIVWYKGAQELIKDQHVHLVSEAGPERGTTHSYLEVDPALPRDKGQYSCLAINRNGQQSKPINVFYRLDLTGIYE